MILHCVFCDFRTDATEHQRNDVLSALAAFSEGVDGVNGFDFGPNLDFEGKSACFDAGFVIRFADRTAADVYANNPTHHALSAKLCDLCNDGAANVTVFDLQV